MAYDINSTVLSGTGSTINEANITTTGDAARGGVNVGAERLFIAELRVAGGVTGTNPTLDVAIHNSDLVAGSYASVATFPQKTVTDAGYQDTGDNTAVPEVPATANYPTRIAVRTPPGKPFLKVVYTVGGTSTPTFRGVSVLLIPVLDRG